MTLFKKSSFSRIASIGLLSLGIVLSPSLTGLGQSVNTLGNQLRSIVDGNPWSADGLGKPDNRESAGTRDPLRPPVEDLTALVPKGYARTTQDYPILFWYLPEVNQDVATNLKVTLSIYEADTAKSLEKEGGVQIYSMNYQLPHSQSNEVASSGIMRFEISDTQLATPLKQDKFYQWQIVLSNGSLEDRIIRSGYLQRIEGDSNLIRQVEAATTAQDRLLIYAQAGLWHETLNTLYELDRANPNNPEFARAWEELISSVEFSDSTEELIEQAW